MEDIMITLWIGLMAVCVVLVPVGIVKTFIQIKRDYDDQYRRK
jgi:hypothetical protein